MSVNAGPGVIEVVRPGMLTTLQDGGRHGLARFGVSASGALDPIAHRIANALVGNGREHDAATLEITGAGTELRFVESCRFALAGADLGARLGELVLPACFVGWARAGDRLSFTERRAGARVAFAIAGGFSASPVFGSAATDLGAGIGGLEGRPLRAATVLARADGRQLTRPTVGRHLYGTRPRERAPAVKSATGAWRVDAHTMAAAARLHAFVGTAAAAILRYFPEPQTSGDRKAMATLARAHAAFARATFTVSSRSSRMGYRFEGVPLAAYADPERLSEPTAPGAIQLPPDGLPILLLADRNTTGGYPRLGHLATADRVRAAQLLPGDVVRFRALTLTAATQAARRQEAAVAAIEAACAGGQKR